jgi:hypothetical protein
MRSYGTVGIELVSPQNPAEAVLPLLFVYDTLEQTAKRLHNSMILSLVLRHTLRVC